MHQSTIGIFGNHLLKAINFKLSTTLRNENYIHPTQQRPLISESVVESVQERICTRLEHFESGSAGFEISAKYVAHLMHVYKEGKSTFTASRMEILIVSLIFVLHDLIGPELEVINRAIVDGRVRMINGAPPEPPTDPCPEIIRALALFLDWYILARRLWFPVDMIPELQRRCCVFKEAFKAVFPEKSGQLNAWNFIKFHGLYHKAGDILMSWSTPFTDTNTFESAHKPNVKNLSGNSNGKDQFITSNRSHN
jgi:hypothetical protein